MSRIGTSSTGGNVNIQDSYGNPLNSSGGALDVNVVSTGASGTAISIYNEVTGVAMSANSVVVTYTVPDSHTFYLTRVNVSTDSVSTFELDFNGIANAKSRVYYTSYNTIFDYSNSAGGYSLAAGTVINLVGTNNSLQGSASFNATLQGILQA